VGSARHPSSFRDPSGFLFRRDGVLLRQVNRAYAPHWNRLFESGLYAELVQRGWLIHHEELDASAGEDGDAYRVLRPEPVPFISYPYEWSFSQHRDAALLTLDIQRLAFEHGMVLKDASAYNIQFLGARPVLIDTLSFESYEEGSPWVAYRQFCQHFLAPLALASYRDVRLSSLLRSHIDGIPLDLACALLPGRARLRFPLLTHLYLHAGSQRRKAHSRQGRTAYKISRLAFAGLIESLRKGVARLRWTPPRTEWGDYYDATNYSEASHAHKAELVTGCLGEISPASVWDLGANDGRFSRLAAGRGIPTVAFDIDPVAVEKNYLEARAQKDPLLLPLRLDLTNPSPALGWAHEERASLAERGPAGAVLALALVHHLAIGNNVPLDRVADFLARLTDHLVIEWVPKEDSQVQRLLASREDVFPGYTEDRFVQAFSRHYTVARHEPIHDSLRVLYLLAR
jgi:ribosomal protein L11 methylase PrmA